MKRAKTFRQMRAQFRRDPARQQAFETAYYALARGVIDRTAKLDGGVFAREYLSGALRELHPDDRDFFNCALAYSFLKAIAGEQPKADKEIEAAQLAARIFNDPLEARKYLPALWAFVFNPDPPSADDWASMMGRLTDQLQHTPSRARDLNELLTRFSEEKIVSTERAHRASAYDRFKRAVGVDSSDRTWVTSTKAYASTIMRDNPGETLKLAKPARSPKTGLVATYPTVKAVYSSLNRLIAADPKGAAVIDKMKSNRKGT